MWRRFGRRDFFVTTCYMFLASEDLHVDRVAIRVSKGGHHVPEEDIRRRFVRSAENFWNIFRPLSDQWHLYANNGTQHEMIAENLGQGIVVKDQTPYNNFMDILPPDDQLNEAQAKSYKTRDDLEREIIGLRHSRDFLIIGNRAVQKARAENTRLGIPNWSYINGKVVAEP